MPGVVEPLQRVDGASGDSLSYPDALRGRKHSMTSLELGGSTR